MEIIAFALLGFILIQEFFNRKERQKLIEAFLAKNLKEVQDLEYERKIKPEAKKEEEFISEAEADESVFDKMIKQINKTE